MSQVAESAGKAPKAESDEVFAAGALTIDFIWREGEAMIRNSPGASTSFSMSAKE